MKKNLLLSSVFVLSMVMSTVMQADTGMSATSTTATTTPTSTTATPASTTSTSTLGGGAKHELNHPCMNIAVLCEEAGFRLSKAVPGKNIWRDCVKPIVAGQTIASVTPSSVDIQGCQAKKSAWKNKQMTPMQTTGMSESSTSPATTSTTQQ